MLNVPPTIKIYVYTGPMDMRKGCNALGGIVRSEYKSDPTDGQLYLFINKRRDRLEDPAFRGRRLLAVLSLAGGGDV